MRCASEIKEIQWRYLRWAFTNWKDCSALLRGAFDNVICTQLWTIVILEDILKIDAHKRFYNLTFLFLKPGT